MIFLFLMPLDMCITIYVSVSNLLLPCIGACGQYAITISKFSPTPIPHNKPTHQPRTQSIRQQIKQHIRFVLSKSCFICHALNSNGGNPTDAGTGWPQQR